MRKNIIKTFIFIFIVLFITFTLSNFILENLSINIWFVEIIINSILAVAIYLLASNIMKYMGKDKK